jgi:hypothetical protein
MTTGFRIQESEVGALTGRRVEEAVTIRLLIPSFRQNRLTFTFRYLRGSFLMASTRLRRSVTAAFMLS